MTGAELLTWVLFLVSHSVALFIGMVIGAVFMAAYITNGLKKMHGAIEDKIRKITEEPTEDWKKGQQKETEEEKWLRRQLDGEDNKEKD